MAQHRIIKITHGDKVHYEIQTRARWWDLWTTETYFDATENGTMAGNYSLKFANEKVAQDYIVKNFSLQKRIVTRIVYT